MNFAPGNYEFTIGADDGVRMWIDGELVYNRWVNKSFSTETIVVPLNDGDHVIEVDYYEWGGGPTDARHGRTNPSAPPDEPQWFAATSTAPASRTSKFKFDRYDDSPNFNWGNGQPERGFTRRRMATTRTP